MKPIARIFSLLLVCFLTIPAFAQEFAQMLSQGPAPYLRGAALLQVTGNLTAGDSADLTLGDYDADGRLDVIVGSAYGDLVFYRHGDDAFDKPVSLLSASLGFAASELRRSQVSPELADLNADGILDLILGAGSELYFYSRQGGIQPGKVLRAEDDRTLGQVIGSTHLAPTAADFDGDGDTDLIVGDEEGRVWWVECLQTRPLRLAPPALLAAGGVPLKVSSRARVAVGDWDGDGRYDLLIGSGDAQLVWCKGQPEGLAAPQPLFAAPPQTPDHEILTQLCPRLADVDGDGRIELLLGCRSGFVAMFIRTPAGPVFAGYLQAHDVPVDVGRYAAPTICRWDSDPYPDLVVGGEDGRVTLFRGRADGRYERGETIVGADGPVLAQPGTGPGRFAWPRLADINGDGVLDLVLGGASGRIEILLNQGTFRSVGFMRIGNEDIMAHGISAIALCDYDGDGDLDLFVGDLAVPNALRADPTYTGPRFVLPSGGLSYYENEAPKGPGMPLFRKGVRLAAYIGKRGRAFGDDAMDAGMLGPFYVEPLTITATGWSFLIGTAPGWYVFDTPRSRVFYPTPMLEAPQGIPNPSFPPLYSCTAVSLRGDTQKGLLCGLGDYGFVCYYPPDQVPQLNGRPN